MRLLCALLISFGLTTIFPQLNAHATFISENSLTLNDKPVNGTAFRHVQVKKCESEYTITGEAKVKLGSFYYSLEDGHNILIQETLQKVNKEAPNWTPFKIIINLKDHASNRSLILKLYERDEKDGKIINEQLINIR